MKRMLSLALAGAMLASLAACGGKEPSKSAGSTPPAGSGGNTSTVESVKPPEPAPETNGLNADNLKLYQKGYFNDGVALITFKDEASGQDYAGLIDTSGKLQFYTKCVSSESHVDGYNYFFNNSSKTLYVLDNDFTVLTSYPLNTEIKETVVGYGGGYFVTYGENTGFDAASSYLYRIFDSTGKELSSLPGYGLPDYAYAPYLGKGVFYFGSQGGLYFTKSDTWLRNGEIDGEIEDTMHYSNFGDSLLVYYDDFSYDGEIYYVDDAGTSHTVSVPINHHFFPIYYGETNGVMLIEFDAFYAYDTQSGQFKEYQGAYAGRLKSAIYGIPCHNGMFAAALLGGDDKYYTVLLNENLEDLCEPVLGEPFALCDSCLYTKSDSELIAYDLQGKELSRISGTFNDTPPFWSDCKDDIIPGRDGYVRSDGSELEIDYSTGKLVTLPE